MASAFVGNIANVIVRGTFSYADTRQTDQLWKLWEVSTLLKSPITTAYGAKTLVSTPHGGSGINDGEQ